jgi:hypothetical protein
MSSASAFLIKLGIKSMFNLGILPRNVFVIEMKLEKDMSL